MTPLTQTSPTPTATGPLQLISDTPTPGEITTLTFTQANVFGLFLTISICLLVQPYGSLLYMKPRSILGRLIFFFWRLNPVACLMESFLICLAVSDGVWHASRRSFAPSTDFWHHLWTTATAIRVLRSHGKTPNQWVELLDPQRLSREGQASVEAAPPPYQETLPTFEADGLGSGQRDITDHIVKPTLLRRRAEFLLGILSTAGMVIVIIKLVLIVIPLHLRLWAALLITGWVAVQVLYLIPAYLDGNQLGRTEVLIRRTLELETKLNNTTLWALLSILLLPLFAFLEYLWLLHPETFPENLPDWYEVCIKLPNGLLLFHFCWLLMEKVSVSCFMNIYGLLSWYGLCVVVGVYIFGQKEVSFYDVIQKFFHSSFYGIIALWMWLFVPGVPFMRRSGKHWGFQRGLALLLNLVTTAFLFLSVLLMYDEKSTYKPGWLEWLG